MTATTLAETQLHNMKQGALNCPDRPVVRDLDPGVRLSVVYEPPRTLYGSIDKRALRDAVAPDLWWTWQVVTPHWSWTLNDEQDVLLLLAGMSVEELRERLEIEKAGVLAAMSREYQGYLFAPKRDR